MNTVLDDKPGVVQADSYTAPPPAEPTQTDLDSGLTAQQVAALLRRYGPNALAEKTISPLQRLTGYFWALFPG